MDGLYAVPAFALLGIAMVVAAALACGGQLLVQRAFSGAEFVADNDVAGFIIAVIGTLYAVLLGFVTVVTWQQYDATRERVALETASVADTWHSAVGLPPAARTRVRRDMLAYARTMLRTEWPAMKHGTPGPQGDMLVMDATTAAALAVPANAAQSNAQATTEHLLDDLHDARQRRLEASASISAFQWTVLAIGALVIIGFCYLFGVAHRPAHLFMTGSVAVMIAAILVLLFELQDPFRSNLGIAPTPWVRLVNHIRDMDAAGAPAPMRMTAGAR